MLNSSNDTLTATSRYRIQSLACGESEMLSRFQQLRRVVITGMGCVTPIGIGRKAFWRALLNGESGVRSITRFDVSNSRVKIAAEVNEFDWEAQLNPKDRKHVPRTVPLALAAAREARRRRCCQRRSLTGSTTRVRGRSRNWRRRPGIHRTTIRILVPWPTQQSECLYNSRINSWRLIK